MSLLEHFWHRKPRDLSALKAELPPKAARNTWFHDVFQSNSWSSQQSSDPEGVLWLESCLDEILTYFLRESDYSDHLIAELLTADADEGLIRRSLARWQLAAKEQRAEFHFSGAWGSAEGQDQTAVNSDEVQLTTLHIGYHRSC